MQEAGDRKAGLHPLTEERAFAWVFLLFSVAILILAVTLQVAVDPRGDFSPGLGVPEKFTTRFNARKEKLQLLERLEGNPPQAYVIGSSRVMWMNPHLIAALTGLRSFNFGIPVGMPEDFYCVSRHILESRNPPPRLIILGIDDVSFSGRGDKIERTAGDAYDFFACPALLKFLDDADRPGPLGLLARKVVTAIDRAYFNETLTCISIRSSGRRMIKQCLLDEAGYTYYSQFDQRLKMGMLSLDDEIEHYKTMWKKQYATYRDLSPARKKYFERLLALCRNNHIRLIVYITPMHERLRESLARDENFAGIDAKLRLYLKEMQQKYAFELWDFASVSSFNGREDDFFDGIHCRVFNNEMMVREMLKPRQSIPRQ